MTVRGRGDLEGERERDPGREGPISRHICRDIHIEKRRWREDVAKESGTGSFRASHVEKWRMSERDKKCGERDQEREREREEKWAKVRVDDRLKNEEGEENPV